MKQRIVNIIGSFIGIAILVFTFAACQSNGDKLPVEKPDEAASVQRRMNSEYLVALATCRLFDDKSMSAKNSFQNTDKDICLSIKKMNTDENPVSISYPFDFVKINEAIKFIAKTIDFPFLNEICGNGEIEVFLTSFDTFVYADETKDKNNLRSFIVDRLIAFRGEWGMYSCMANSSGTYSFDDKDVSIMEHSSHIRFGENSIDKDFTPPLYQFYVKIENNVTSLACRESDEVGYFPPVTSLQWTVLEGGDIVGSEELFGTDELCEMPEMSQQCVITGIGDDYFLVSGKYHLEKIFFDEYTLFFMDDEPAKATDFTTGDEVAVTFNQLYERYNPKVAVANRIEKN